VDFHALRHTHVTNLVRTGAPLAEVQRIARLSTPTLLDRYHHSDQDEHQAIIGKLPKSKLDEAE